MNDTRTLIVWYERKKVGQLQDNQGIWSFGYDAQWLSYAKAFSLTPQLPMTQRLHIDDSSKRYVQWFFDNLLPEENARQVLCNDKTLGLPERVAKNEINKMRSLITKAFDVLYQQVETAPHTIHKPGDLRMLREIKYRVLNEMLAKLD